MRSARRASLGETTVNSLLLRGRIPPSGRQTAYALGRGRYAARTYTASNLLSGKKKVTRLDSLCKYQKPKTQLRRNRTQRLRRQKAKYQENVILDMYTLP